MADKPKLRLASPPVPGPLGTLPREADGPHGAVYRVTDIPSIELEHEDDRIVPLANFGAEIMARVVLGDGEQQDQRVRLRVLAPDQTAHEFDVTPKEFASLAWVDRVPGALLWPPPRKAWVRTAITLTSEPKAVVVRRHLGWHRLDGRWVWLHAGGVLGGDASASAVEVEVEPELAYLTLPPPPSPDEIASLARLTLRLVGVAPLKVTAPLLGSALVPALTEATHGVLLVGKSGSGKSELAAQVQSLYGSGVSRGSDLRVAWSSSPHALEMLAFRAKDCALVVDDFVSGTASGDEEVFDRISRGQGNRAGRTRMRGPSYYPRGLVISTAESLPPIGSAVARTLVLRHDRIDWSLLTSLQESADAGVHASTMAAFLIWVAERKEQIERWVLARTRKMMGRFDTAGVHRRTPPALASAEAALAVFVRFCFEVEAVTAGEADRLVSGFHGAFRECLLEQLDVQLAADPGRLLLCRVGRALAEGRGHLVDVGGDLEHGRGQRLGWVKGGVAYLDPDAALNVAAGGELARMSVEQVGKALDDAGLLERIDRRGDSRRYKSRVVAGGERVSGWAVRVADLQDGHREISLPVGVDTDHGLDWSADWFA